MRVEARVGPRQHPGGLVLVKEGQAHEEPEHGAAERLRQTGRVMGGPDDKCAVGPNAAVGDEEVQMRMPVGP